MRGTMNGVPRWALVAVVTVHGLIHLMGVVKGFGWAEVGRLAEPIGTTGAVAWLVAAALVLASAAMIARRTRGWWLVTALAAMVSQAVILTSWDDAKVGTVANVVMLLAAGYGYAAHGPRSLQAEYWRRAKATLDGQPITDDVVGDVDLAHLPPLVAAYVRRCGAVGRPRVVDFRAAIHGRIRGGPGTPWMSFTGEQVNTYGRHPRRLFFIRAIRAGLPTDVLHVYDGGVATMRARLCSILPVLDLAGPEMDRAETVTVFNRI